MTMYDNCMTMFDYCMTTVDHEQYFIRKFVFRKEQ